ncbi:MAG: hypothetical protein CSA83_02975 [Actinomycetales bacterium]|nr:MAG: hypothetical protein CSA83_02975 [Actinomycetales bacterium]
MSSREMLSVGIDVGTTTTQVVVSQLSVTNQARAGLVPRLDVDQRTILYRSEAHFTPLTAPDVVDVDALVSIVRADYEKAGIKPSQVETGAVIITGETARTKNAQAIRRNISLMWWQLILVAVQQMLRYSVPVNMSLQQHLWLVVAKFS